MAYFHYFHLKDFGDFDFFTVRNSGSHAHAHPVGWRFVSGAEKPPSSVRNNGSTACAFLFIQVSEVQTT
jgi:hypothetical protein